MTQARRALPHEHAEPVKHMTPPSVTRIPRRRVVLGALGLIVLVVAASAWAIRSRSIEPPQAPEESTRAPPAARDRAVAHACTQAALAEARRLGAEATLGARVLLERNQTVDLHPGTAAALLSLRPWLSAPPDLQDVANHSTVSVEVCVFPVADGRVLAVGVHSTERRNVSLPAARAMAVVALGPARGSVAFEDVADIDQTRRTSVAHLFGARGESTELLVKALTHRLGINLHDLRDLRDVEPPADGRDASAPPVAPPAPKQPRLPEAGADEHAGRAPTPAPPGAPAQGPPVKDAPDATPSEPRSASLLGGCEAAHDPPAASMPRGPETRPQHVDETPQRDPPSTAPAPPGPAPSTSSRPESSCCADQENKAAAPRGSATPAPASADPAPAGPTDEAPPAAAPTPTPTPTPSLTDDRSGLWLGVELDLWGLIG